MSPRRTHAAFLRRLIASVRAFFYFRRPQVEVAAETGCGLVRTENQDHFRVDSSRLVFIVADGMGGGEGGALASEIVCRRIAEAVKGERDFGRRVRAADAAIAAASEEIGDYARSHGFAQMGTTVVVLLIDPRDLTSAAVGHVGDSRLYRWRGGVLEMLTRDHTVADELAQRGGFVTSGFRDRLHPLSHVLTRAVGVTKDVKVDWRSVTLRRADRLLLCSDGVYDMLANDRIAAVFACGGSMRETVQRIATRVTAAGAEDNFTAVCIRMGERK